MNRILFAIQFYNLNNAHLQQFIHPRDLVGHAQNVLYCLRHSAVSKEDERVPLACCIRFSGEESFNEFRRVRYEVFEFPIDGIDGKDSVLANI